MTAKNCTLTQERLKELLRYAPDTGAFYWRSGAGNAVKRFDKAGYKNSAGYISIKIDGKLYFAHRLAWLYMAGEWPKNQIDHINRARHDNTFCNLRDVTIRENHHNAKHNNDYVGVSFHRIKEKWGASIYKDKRLHHLGYFITHLAACCARHQEDISYES